MSDKVKLSKDGSSIDFVQSESLPTSLKKFRQSPEIEGFYRFVFENDLQKEAYEILDQIISERKTKKAVTKKDSAVSAKEAKEVQDTKSSVRSSSRVLNEKPEVKGGKPGKSGMDAKKLKAHRR
jgi:hypothetical protein